MTSEQIENLKGRLDERCVDGEGINVTREDVERLLDEREALLEALKEAQRIIDGEVCSTNDHGADCRNLLAVIAKAES